MFAKISNPVNSRRTKHLGICLIILLCWHQTAAQHRFNVWQSQGPTYDITSLEIAPSSPNVLVAAGGDYCCGWGVYKTTNYGFYWLGITPFPPSLPYSLGPVAIDPTDAQVFYVYKAPLGVFKTTNGGQSWDLVLPKWVSSLEIAPSDRNVLYAMGEFFYVSTNGGADWTTRQLPLPGGSNYGSLAVHPNNPNIIFAQINNYYTFGGTYKSVNGGLTWNALNIPGSSMVVDPGNPDVVYAVSEAYPPENGFRKSVDGGSTWTFIPTPYSPSALAIDTRRNTIYIGTETQGVYKSSNDGASWQAFNNGLLEPPDVYELIMDSDGGILHAATSCCVFSVRVIPKSNADFDGDGRSDISVFRPSDSVWYLNRTLQGFSATQFGLSTDKITPADFDGDGKTDIAVYRDGTWFWLNSSNGNFNAIQFGLADDIPVPADYTGDGRAELAVYRGGNWFTLDLNYNQVQAVHFGLSSDKPVVGDYDGDDRADFAVYRDGIWYLLQSTLGFAAIQFGLSTDQLVPADYDGDGKTDLAVYRDGIWYLLGSQTGFAAFQFGIGSDIPAPADYDGDGCADAAVYRDGNWYLQQSANGFAAVRFGLTTDKPVPSAFLP